MRPVRWLTIALAVLAVAGCGDEGDASAPTPTAPQPVSALVVADQRVDVEVADDDAERARGLGNRDRLARDAGMYFVLPNEAPSFWMKGMRFPLDMIWIKDGRVVDVTADVPHEPPGTPDSRLPTYSPARPADRVLEVNAGWAKRHGVTRGDKVVYIR